jgi:hypothetical protein
MRKSILLVTGLATLAGTLATTARAEHPTYDDGITVDGNPADWNLAADYFADLVPDGRPGGAVMARLYLRYDCAAKVLSALVLDVEADGEMVSLDPTKAWLRLHEAGLADDLLVDGTGAGATAFRSFEWVRTLPGDPLAPLIGFEASAQLDEGSYTSFEAGLDIDGTFASTGFSGFDALAMDQQADDWSALGSARVRVQYPYNGGPALFPTTEIDLDGDGGSDITTQSWCIDTDHVIHNNTWYCTTILSSYSYPNGLDDTRRENLDVVNWILNQGFVGQDAGDGLGVYTYGDQQLAIWALLENADSPNGLGPYSSQRVNRILALAADSVGLNNPAVTYEPPCDGVVGLILVPTDCGAGNFQMLVAQILMAEYPAFCADHSLALHLACEPVTTDADDQPRAFRLAPASPNPFNPSTTLTVSLEQMGPASLKVFDVGGRLVATLLDGLQPAGEQRVVFHAQGMASGTYIAVLRGEGGVSSQKLVLVK